MRRYIAVIISVYMIVITLSGCAQTSANLPDNTRISIICTIFPQYSWARQIIGDTADNIDLTILLNNRIDLHSYQPSVEDIAKISVCDLFIYVGGESDIWVDDALNQAVNSNMLVINLLDALGDAVKVEEIIEGMDDEAAQHDGVEPNEDGEEEDEDEDYDEHVWLSLKNAMLFCEVIADAISSLDPEKAVEYGNNAAAYIEQLSALDVEYQSVVDAAPVRTLLFGDRFPFRYLVDDYGLSYHAAFPGCSAETEASFDTIVYLARKMDEAELRTVMVTESSDQSIAKTIISNTESQSQQILVMDSMQSVTSSNVTYLSIMESNLNALREALN